MQRYVKVPSKRFSCFCVPQFVSRSQCSQPLQSEGTDSMAKRAASSRGDQLHCDDCGYEAGPSHRESLNRRVLWLHQLRKHAATASARRLADETRRWIAAQAAKKRTAKRAIQFTDILVCDLCSRKFLGRQTLALHMNNAHHLANAQQLAAAANCDMCAKTFLKRHFVDRHFRVAHALQPIVRHEKPIERQCDDCHVRRTGANLFFHWSQRHTPRRVARTAHRRAAVQCDSCQRRLDSKRDLVKHVARKHSM